MTGATSIAVQPLTSAAFAPFGHVGRAGEGITRSIRNDSVTLTKTPATFRKDDSAIDLALDIYDVAPAGDAVEIAQGERHAHSSQMFVPMAAASYLVVVWDGNPAEDANASAFVCGPQDVVIYNPGIWHHGIIALGTRGSFASTMFRTRGGRDVEFVDLAQPLTIDVTDRGR